MRHKSGSPAQRRRTAACIDANCGRLIPRSSRTRSPEAPGGTRQPDHGDDPLRPSAWLFETAKSIASTNVHSTATLSRAAEQSSPRRARTRRPYAR